MAAIINADDGVISGASGLKLSSDTSGALNIQTNGVTAIAISASQAVSFPATTSLNFTSANITTLTSSSATITNLLATTLTVSSVGIFPAGSASSAAITTAGDTNTGIFFPAADTIAFTEGGVEAARFDSSGNFGLGVTPSAVSGSYKNIQNGAAVLMGKAGQADVYLNANATFNSGWKYIVNGFATRYSQNDVAGGAHTWFTAASGTADNAISFTQAMTLDASGRLGVGDSSPQASYRVTITGGGVLNTPVGGITFRQGATDVCYFGNVSTDNTTDWEIWNPRNGYTRFATNNTERARITAAGDFLIGGTTAESKLNVYSGGSTFSSGTMPAGMTIYGATTDGQGSMLSFKAASGDQGIAGIAGLRSSGYQTELRFYTNNTNSQNAFTERARITSGGDFLVNTTTSASFGNGHRIYRNVSENAYVLSVDAGVEYSCLFQAASTSGYSVSNTAMLVAKNSSTSRSINAAGTINASGADYAEYMTKAGDFVLAKGDVCGIDANGKLTNVFADAVSFVVKSTDPSYVGGDSWGSAKAIGLKMPDGNATQEEKDAFNAALEVARQKVDRIAFAGQVPVNVLGATPGQYIVPVNDNGAIKGMAVSNPTFEQYQAAVGKVIAIRDDGRATIIVKVV